MKFIIVQLIVVAFLFTATVSAEEADKKEGDKKQPAKEQVEKKEEKKPAEVAPAKEVRKLLVQKIEAIDVEEALAKSLEEAIVLDIGNREGFSVVTSAEMLTTVKHAQAGMELGCEGSDACLVEVQKKLAVETLIAGKISKLGDEFVLSLNTVNVANKTVGNRVTVQGKDLAELKGKIKNTIDQIFGFAKQKQMFTLKEGEELKVAVMPLAARGMDQSTADALTSILSAQLNQIKGISVISQDDIKAMLSKVSLDSSVACTDSMECVIEIGASLGLSKLVTGAIGKVKNTYVISVQLIDTRKADVQNRVLESFAGDADELKNAIKLAAYQIAGVDYTSKPGSVNFTFNVSEAKFQLGDEKGKIADSQIDMKNLIPGRYYLKVLADEEDYFPLQTDIYVAPGANNVKTFTVLEKPTPWYKTWWFWTITGAVVAGAATTTAIMLTTQDAPPGEGTITIKSE